MVATINRALSFYVVHFILTGDKDGKTCVTGGIPCGGGGCIEAARDPFGKLRAGSSTAVVLRAGRAKDILAQDDKRSKGSQFGKYPGRNLFRSFS